MMPGALHVEHVVIGGGLVGLATARELLLRGAGRTAVLEAETSICTHQSGRNSGVIHAGIYYAPNSLKARLCLRGLHATYEYLKKHSIPHQRVGKLIVAQDDSQRNEVLELFRNAQTNGVPDVKILDSLEEMRKIEPEVGGVAALYSPHTGIVDWGVVGEYYARDVKEMGGEILTGMKVEGMELTGNGVKVKAMDGRTVIGDGIVSCAGAQSDRVAEMLGGERAPRMIPVRGEYMKVNDEDLASRIRGNIYPLPRSGKGAPFLGVHFTRTIYDEVLVGPSAMIAMSRGRYEGGIDWGDVRDMFGYQGFWRMCGKYWWYGLGEMWRKVNIEAARREASMLVPRLKRNGLVKVGRNGIRGQAVDKNGGLIGDFVFERGGKGRVLHVRNAPSPGATASLAIAEMVADEYAT